MTLIQKLKSFVLLPNSLGGTSLNNLLSSVSYSLRINSSALVAAFVLESMANLDSDADSGR